MKKIILVILLCACAWLVKLSYDFFQFSAQQTEIQQNLQRVLKENAALNDQLAALKRERQPVAAAEKTTAVESDAIDPLFLLSQQLNVVELALDQRQAILALEKLNRLTLQVEKLPLADALKKGLQQSLSKDIDIVQKFSQAHMDEQARLTAVLQQIDALLQQALQQTQLDVAPPENSGFWQRWFKLERISDVRVGLNQRALILKEAQLRLMMARQMLMQDQYLEFQQEMTDIENILKLLPDAQTQQIIQQIIQLKQTPKLTQPQLNTRALVGVL